MGRGRAKAKQAKVARQLKYQTSGTSIEDLREELGAAPPPSAVADGDTEDTYEDPYDDPYDIEDEDDDPYDDLADRYLRDAGERSD